MQKVIESLQYQLKSREDIYEFNGGKPDCVMMKELLADINALKRTIRIYESKMERLEDQEVDSEITIEMESGKDIPIREWARNNGLDESYARQKARRGMLTTAHKIGRDWFVSNLELNQDNRKKKK